MAKYLVMNHLNGTLAATDITGTGIVAQLRPAAISDHVGQYCASFASLTLASGVNLVANDVIEMGILPAGHVPVDFILASDSWDSNASPTLAGSIGVMAGLIGDTSRVMTDVGVEGGTAVVWGKTAVSDFVRCLSPLFQRLAPSFTAHRSIGMKVTTAAATNVAAARRLDFTLITRPSVRGA